ncbi:orotidine-5-phosphate decarboxylase/orotate phosphoribosyltransferase [Besnoitia besnoiti]|uniref:Orotidine 5'-phosphate decarboxylase n=1 Tax=Besnoitia besnoiti TaxID=94643 RepID=A0A2A9ML47_BESBE|nr:orotidine-5-phosphate decarboxylase/orotate phosphoribosyltransferase [Besnoitia besnoiti]PFH37964.1 orotidine-5-phosphate decarboxylase/orotate phosphoribosyltransferase [Besnoitia besnoiti]
MSANGAEPTSSVQASPAARRNDTNFFKKLNARIDAVDSLLTVGLDPHSAELPAPASAEGAFAFCERVIKATLPYACCYKPNCAFFEAFGSKGVQVLERVCALIPDDIPILLDAKRGDIGTTAQAYAVAAFEGLQAEGVTVNAYMGRDAVRPFLSYRDRGVFVLAKTSNPSSNELQTLLVRAGPQSAPEEQIPLYVQVARLCNDIARESISEGGSALQPGQSLRQNASGGGVGLVVGATDVKALQEVRRACPDLYILAPGIGAQGGDLEEAMEAGLCKDGKGMLIPISRGISRAQDMAAQANLYREQINAVRKRVVQR